MTGSHKRLTNNEKSKIDFYISKGLSMRATARRIGRSDGTVRAYLKGNELYGVNGAPGRKQLLTDEQKQQVIDKWSKIGMTAKEIIRTSNLNVSESYVYNILRESGAVRKRRAQQNADYSENEEEELRDGSDEMILSEESYNSYHSLAEANDEHEGGVQITSVRTLVNNFEDAEDRKPSLSSLIQTTDQNQPNMSTPQSQQTIDQETSVTPTVICTSTPGVVFTVQEYNPPEESFPSSQPSAESYATSQPSAETFSSIQPSAEPYSPSFTVPPRSSKSANAQLLSNRPSCVLSRDGMDSECKVFSNFVACKLRVYPDKIKNLVQHQINNVIFDADMGKFEVPYPSSKQNGTPSTISSQQNGTRRRPLGQSIY